MTGSFTPQVSENVYYRRVEETLIETSIPDILLQINQDYIALNSNKILYLSKDGNKVNIYCEDKIKYAINLDLDSIWKKTSHFHNFRRISKSLIVNIDHILSVKRNGFKYVFLDNGEELYFDEEKLSHVLLGYHTV